MANREAACSCGQLRLTIQGEPFAVGICHCLACQRRTADRGVELVAAHPGDARLAYDVACCESRAGRTADAIEHLRQSIGLHANLRSLAGGDPALDPIGDEPAFRKLVG